MSADPAVPTLAAVLLTMSEQLAPVLEAVDGYRQQCIERGFEADHASAMGAEYHAFLLSVIAKSQGVG